MKITLIEPFFTGSHATWVEGYAKYSRHDIKILSLSGNYWKWRMHGGAVTLARQFLEGEEKPDLLLVTDMLDVTTFLALTRQKTAHIPVAIYFHENQICYPWSPKDRDIIHKRDHHYGFINYVSALAADAVFFNSLYHKNAFLEKLPGFLRHFPDLRELSGVDTIAAKSHVLHLGLELQKFEQTLKKRNYSQIKFDVPLILWNHRWEYDKNPEEFFQVLFTLTEQGLDFRVAILGGKFFKGPPVFEKARERLGEKIVQYGYVTDFAEYAKWLHAADILPVTSHQDFFGASVVEAIYCGCYPLLPKRLSYPELIPYDTSPENFYFDTQDLIKKLTWAIRKIGTIRKQNLRQYIEQYSWQNMALHYDNVLNKESEMFNSS